MKSKEMILKFLVSTLLFVAVPAMAVPPIISYQGYLQDGAAMPADGDYAITFSLYDSPNAGAELLWSESYSSVAISAGIFNVDLGSVQPFQPEDFAGDSLWLGIQIAEGDELVPRTRLVAVPWAIRAAVADSALNGGGSGDGHSLDASDGDPVNAVFVDENGNVGIGTQEPGERKLNVAGELEATGIRFPWSFGPDLEYVGFEGNSISFGHPGISEDFIGYKNNTFHFRDSPFGGDDFQPDVHIHGALYVGQSDHAGSAIHLNGSDFVIKQPDRGSGGRALVHWVDNVLCLNFESDFSGGTRVMGPSLRVDGYLRIDGGSDLAEPFDSTDVKTAEPGMLMSIDENHPGKVKISESPYDPKVIGVVSGAGGVNPGLVMGQNGTLADGELPIAMAGRVYCRACTENGNIRPGDLLTTSSLPGFAMKASENAGARGAIIGKSMTSLTEDEGLVLVVVQPQ